jgi:hypothetical protein
MKALLKYAIRDMRSRGRTFFSDRMVSGLQQPSYYALGKEDYKVTERSHGPVGRVTPNEFRYADTSRGVFEVEPPIREQLDFSDLVQYPPFPSK